MFIPAEVGSERVRRAKLHVLDKDSDDGHRKADCSDCARGGSPGLCGRACRDVRRDERPDPAGHGRTRRSEEHTSELQSLMRISYAVFCLKKKKKTMTKKLCQR